jgi:hypothetical protein
LTRSNHAGLGGILTKTGHGVSKPPSNKANFHRAKAGPSIQSAKRPSSTCLTWSVSDLQSTNAASHPKAPESIHAAAFKFKPGPFRSSSVEKLAESVWTIPERAWSDGCTDDDILNLPGISSSNELPEVNLSRDGAQHVDKEPHGARDKIFEPQIDAHPPSTRSQKSIDTKLSSKRGNQLRGRSSVYESQPLLRRVNPPTDTIDSSISIDNLLGQCYQAQQEVAQRITQENKDLVETGLSGREADRPSSTYTVYSSARHHGHGLLEESYEDDGEQDRIGTDEGYKIMNEEILETYPSFEEGYEEFAECEEVGEEGFSGIESEAGFQAQGEKIDETWEHERIDAMGYPTLPGLKQSTRRTDEAQRRFWRPNKLY